MNKPFFSIIIPTLNEEHYLPSLLKSLIKQKYIDFEVFVVDAQSTDKTISIAKSYIPKLPNLTILESDKKNVSWQRNMGAKLAHGQYLVFFDADVTIPKNYLFAIHEVLLKKKYLLLTTWISPDTMYSHDILMMTIANIGLEMTKLIERPFSGGYNTVVEKGLFDHLGGYDERIVHSEDFEFSERCHDAGVRIHIMQKPRAVFSMRRYRKYGYFDILKKNATSAGYSLLKKPITKAVFDYPMGGEMYKHNIKISKNKSKNLEKFLLKSLKKIFTV